MLERDRRRLAFEFKASPAPSLTRGFHQAAPDIGPEHTFIVAPVERPYPIADAATPCPPGRLPMQVGSERRAARGDPRRSGVMPPDTGWQNIT